MVNFSLKKFANNRAPTEKDSAVPPYTQAAHITTMLYADVLYGKLCEVVGAHDMSTLKKIIINKVGSSNCYNPREFWGMHPQAQDDCFFFLSAVTFSNPERF